MVTLSKIYTKTGDGGRTRLGDGEEVAKTHLRVEAYGTVDELNAVLGLAMTTPLPAVQKPFLFLWENSKIKILGILWRLI